MQILRKSLSLFVLLLIAIASVANHFEGQITFVRKSFYDTTYLQYYIKQDRIRIDKYEEKGGPLIQTLLVDLEKETVTAVNPEKKLYRPLNISSGGSGKKSHFEVIKTNNFRRIKGIKCYQWRVRNEKLNSEIAYWVTKKRFGFFDDLFDLLKRTERTYHFFSQIPGNEGYFPMLAVERTLLRDERERLEVKNINRNKLSESLFIIPDNYRELLLSQKIRN